MKKLLKIIGIVALIVVLLIAALLVKVVSDQKKQAEDQKNMVKTDEELIGTHLYIPREGLDAVDVNLYLPEKGELLPLIVNLHGGAFIAGDADTLDTQSDRISKSWGAVVVTVNYKLMQGEITKQYAVDEVKDTVKYFISHAEEYRVDPQKIFVLGYSAGGYHAMASVLQLHKEGITVRGQILCYAFLSDILEQYDALTDEQKETIPPALFLLAGDEPIGKGSLDYQAALEAHGVHTEAKIYDGALHGFIEENNPEYETLHNKSSKSPAQEVMARDAEDYILHWVLAQLK